MTITRETAAKSQAAWLRALERTSAIESDPRRTLPSVITELAATYADAPALLSPGQTLSFRALDARANAYAHWALASGLGNGAVTALLMRNAAEYLAAWIGITRGGGTVALINTNLDGAALAHAINIAGCKALIAATPPLAEAARSAHAHIENSLQLWSDHDAGAGFERLDTALAAMPVEPPADLAVHAPELNQRALYIYTSGTTGLSKAASISHRRIMQWSHWFAGMMDTGPHDRMFNVLPMYHAIGGVVATVAPLLGGGSVKIAERFSASRFWDEAVAAECTLFQYIGELCRYLATSPPHPLERAHKLRLAAGNGLSLPVWQAFQQRFAIPDILEYYAATEGTFSLYNCEGKPGAIGRIPSFLRGRLGVALVRHDIETALPVRDANGRCIRCATGEAGEAIGRIGNANATKAGAAAFEGYTDSAASAAKVLHDVFEAGDVWYRTGDLMRQDADGFFSFVDRIGDTFRWKGENVATREVADVLANAPGVAEVIVYGVAISGIEGRAGMATVVPGDGFDIARLRAHAAAHLPAYARPVFVRVASHLDATATFKPRVADYARDGFDPARTVDNLYFDDPAADRFVPLDRELHARLVSGHIRL